ncbi:MAG: RHS repeat-associated core domain-containing protein [Bacteroidota bacterium]
MHRYEYDADNRITRVYTSSDGVVWDNDAKYFYYLHGPLARTELGNEKVQGIDYAYTLQGWLKGVNSNSLEADNDMGKDGSTISYSNNSANLHKNIAKDAYGYSLHYYNNDYSPIAQATATYKSFLATSPTVNSLYNGNISAMATSIRDARLMVGAQNTNSNYYGAMPQLVAYRYDQLNRIKSSTVLSNTIASNSWNPVGGNNSYNTNYTYDRNGNIITLNRNGSTNNSEIDKLKYKYYMPDNVTTYDPSDETTFTNGSGLLMEVTNKLASVSDESTITGGTDIQNQTNINNYSYDEIGNLISDKSEQIDRIEWNVYGKISKVIRLASSEKADLEFAYDPMGNRISKKVIKKLLNSTTGLYEPGLTSITYYTRDAQGNVMANYDVKETQPNYLYLSELNIYGSSRIGILKKDLMLAQSFDNTYIRSMIGKKQYELTNHLGNVLTTISDRKIPHFNTTNGAFDYYQADIISSTDYYAFGMEMGGRKYPLNSTYRYGFNGKENDGETGTQDYGFRIYNPSIAKFLSVDPLTKDYPWYTPYQFAGNKPINSVDLDGLEEDPRWMAYDPMGAITVGCGEFLDAWANLFSFDFVQTFSATKTNNSTTAGATTATNTTTISNTTTASYNGWSLFNPNSYSPNGGSTIPAPKIKVSNETTITNETKVTTTLGPFSTTKSNATSSNGEKSSSTSVSVGRTSNSGTPVSVSATKANSNKSGQTNSVKVTVGPEAANIYVEAVNKPSSTTVNAGGNLFFTTMDIRGWSFSSNTNVSVSVTQPKK